MGPIRTRLVLIPALVAVLLVCAAPSGAYATTVAEKRAEAARIQGQLASLDTRLEIAVEDYNQARSRYGRVNAKVTSNKAKLRSMTLRIGQLQRSLGVRASTMYRTGPIGPLEVLLGATSFRDLATTWDLLDAWNHQQASSVHDLRAARIAAQALQKQLDALRVQAKSQFKVVSARKKTVLGQIASRKAMLGGLQSDIASLVAQAQASARGTVPSTFRWPTPTRQPRSSVVQIARRYLGRPYVWAGSGPGSFDCSGFTMFVYSQVGVSLSHSSQSQIGEGQRVSRSDLQVGDLVFFGSPIHHVGLYIGGGMMIHAPQTGDVVRVAPLLHDYVGACRP